MTMNTTELVNDIKKRYHHNEFKLYLKEKYQNKLMLPYNGGMWKTDITFISNLKSLNDQEYIILLDTYDNPIKVNVKDLLQKALESYNTVMQEWFNELDSYVGLR